jgi:hypothetical protein
MQSSRTSWHGQNLVMGKKATFRCRCLPANSRSPVCTLSRMLLSSAGIDSAAQLPVSSAVAGGHTSPIVSRWFVWQPVTSCTECQCHCGKLWPRPTQESGLSGQALPLKGCTSNLHFMKGCVSTLHFVVECPAYDHTRDQFPDVFTYQHGQPVCMP